MTEYGIADLRGRDDEEVITSLKIADSRFQDALLKEAKRAGKVRANYEIPDHARNNRPERLERELARYRARDMFPAFLFGTDLTPEEVLLRKALGRLKQNLRWWKFQAPRFAEISKTIAVPDQAQPYLKRIALITHTL